MQNGANIAKFIRGLNTAARPVAEREFAMLLAAKRQTDPKATEIARLRIVPPGGTGAPFAVRFRLRKRSSLFAYPQVKKGVLDTAATLFHVTFRQEMNAPAWDPAVETWDVIEAAK